MMTREAATKLFESFIESVMAQGGIKNLATLDRLREALTVLKQGNGNEKKVSGETSEEGRQTA